MEVDCSTAICYGSERDPHTHAPGSPIACSNQLSYLPTPYGLELRLYVCITVVFPCLKVNANAASGSHQAPRQVNANANTIELTTHFDVPSQIWGQKYNLYTRFLKS